MKHSRFASLSFLPRLGGRRASFKIGVVATLAIAVAANIAVLGNLGVMFGRVVPGAAHQNLLVPYFKPLGFKAMPPSLWGVFRPTYDRMVETLKHHATLALYQEQGATLSGPNGGERVRYLYVTPSLSQVLGVQASRGRLVKASDAARGAAPVIVLSDRFARARFGSPSTALNQSMTLDKTTYRVVGILPAALSFPPDKSVVGWVPFPPELTGTKNSWNFGIHAILRPKVKLSTTAVRAALDHAYHQTLPTYNAASQGFLHSLDLAPRVESLAQRLYGPLTDQLVLLELAALLLLLLVLANLVGLATADALVRRHELATRAALGAGVWKLFVERARELGLLGLVGWAIGVGLGWLSSRALASTVGQAGAASALSWPVLLLTLAAILVVTTLLAAGDVHRLRTPQTLVADLLTGGRATGGKILVRTLRALIVLQLAASVVLLVVATHLHANVFGLTHGDMGFKPNGVAFIGVSLPSSEGNQTEEKHKRHMKEMRRFVPHLLKQLSHTPGITGIAELTVPPLSGDVTSTNASLRPPPNDKQSIGQVINDQTVSAGVVNVLGLRVLAGNPSDIFTISGKAIFIDRVAAEKFWPHTKPGDIVGRTLYVYDEPWRVAAIIAPLRMRAYGKIDGTVFMSYTDTVVVSPPAFAVRSILPPHMLRRELARSVWAINPQARVHKFATAESLIAQAYAARDQLGRVFGVLAIVAMLIAAVGLFALLAYRSLVRRPEFAIRGALGATPGRLLGSVLTEAVVLWASGCAIGVPTAYGLSVALASYLPALGLPATFVVVAVIVALCAITVTAALVPARRAACINLTDNLST
jgi:predicted permease